jgi:RNA polymerase sigma-70 factor (ECF subfamily)
MLPYDEKQLLKELSEGSEEAFKRLFETYRDRLCHYVFRLVKSGPIAEELIMDVFLKIWTGRELVCRIENINAFLFRVAHNKSIDFFRAASKDIRLKELLLEEMQASPETLADNRLKNRELEEKLREAISLLPPQRRKVYSLSREQELSHDQIAESLHISRNTVNNHIVDAQRFIRNYLLKHLDFTSMIFFF